MKTVIKNTYIPFISDDHLFDCLERLYNAYEGTKTKMDIAKFYSNKIDGIKLRFDVIFNKISEEEAIMAEVQRQIDKTVNNALGHFHEELLGGLDGLMVFPVGNGFDLKNPENTIFAEVKNKHNTMNSSSSESTFKKLEKFANDYENATAYLVQVIAEKSLDELWIRQNKGKEIIYSHDRVRIISADRFYEKFTGDQEAFKKVCDALPIATRDFLKNKPATKRPNNTQLFMELEYRAKQNNVDILTQLLNDNFNTYAGF